MLCPECKGQGKITLFVSIVPCRHCDGSGSIADHEPDPQTIMELDACVDDDMENRESD